MPATATPAPRTSTPLDKGKLANAWLGNEATVYVILGVVVVAGVFTAFIAMRSADPVLANDAYEYGQKSEGQTQRNLLPAQRARNHAATPEDAPIK